MIAIGGKLDSILFLFGNIEVKAMLNIDAAGRYKKWSLEIVIITVIKRTKTRKLTIIGNRARVSL